MVLGACLDKRLLGLGNQLDCKWFAFTHRQTLFCYLPAVGEKSQDSVYAA